jgi:hypothetical protein
LFEVLSEFVEVRNQVSIGQHAEVHTAVVGDDRQVEAKRVVDRHERPELEQLRAARVERHLRAGHIGGDEVDHRLARELRLRCHHARGECLEGRWRPVGKVGESARGDRLSRSLEVAGGGRHAGDPLFRSHGTQRDLDDHGTHHVPEPVTLRFVADADGSEDPKFLRHRLAAIV